MTIPIVELNLDEKELSNDIKFALWSTHSSSDYRNDRERPYNGQSHTDNGIRGKTEVKGLTFRDIRDCYVKGVLLSCGGQLPWNETSKCWDYTGCEGDRKSSETNKISIRQY